jgi:signal transduction histidine kinase
MSSSDRADHEQRPRAGEREAPWFRSISARTGLQGKLVLSFMFLLIVTLGGSSWQFVTESRAITEEVLGTKLTTVADTAAVAAEAALARGDRAELGSVGRRVACGKDVVGVAFFSPSGQLLASSWRDGDPHGLHARMVTNPRDNSAGDSPRRVVRRVDPSLGPYVEATVPVRASDRIAADVASGARSPSRVIGFVTVGLSEVNNASRIGQAQAIVVLIGAVSALVSLPLVYMLVHRIFHPIRALVDATNRIAAGDLGTEVAIHRTDVIGELARSFNEMVKKVRGQQEQLEAANEKLLAANVQLESANAQLESANEQLAEANRGLEEKVRQRTAQVETANRRLRSEIAEKEDFLRAVSHDLNAPLRNISGMATMLLMKHRERFDEDVIHRLERIRKNVEVETDLIAELLELSRIKTRRQKGEPVELAPLIAELGGVLEEDLRSKQIALVVDTPLPVVVAERARMRQVFQNLIDNAIKYMGEGPTREIHVGCTVRHEEAEFYVRDTGIGIEPEDLDKVFFVFRRGKSATVQSVAGKGIGLASVKSIVETYEGSISVESEVGKGTTFRFTINGKHVPESQQLAHRGAAPREATPLAARVSPAPTKPTAPRAA